MRYIQQVRLDVSKPMDLNHLKELIPYVHKVTTKITTNVIFLWFNAYLWFKNVFMHTCGLCLYSMLSISHVYIKNIKFCVFILSVSNFRATSIFFLVSDIRKHSKNLKNAGRSYRH